MGCGGRPLSEQIPKKLVKLTLSLDLDLDYGTKSGRLLFCEQPTTTSFQWGRKEGGGE